MTVIALTAVAALVVILVRQPFVVSAAGPTPTVTSATVSTRDVQDERQVTVTVRAQTGVKIISPRAGRITAWRCDALESGTSPLSVDGVRVLALASDVPWWRDVVSGDTGVDVDALHAELTRLGHDVSADGKRVGAASIRAVRELARASGADEPKDGTIALSQMLWLPLASVTLSECVATIGDSVQVGDELGTQTPVLASATVAAVADVVPGDRELSVDGTVVAVDADGAVTDSAELAALGATASVTAALAEEGDGTLTASFRLREPVRVTVVPPVAVSTQDGVTGCVLADGQVHAVTLVGSQLGQTYVLPENDTVLSEVSLTPPDSAECS